ncbi:metallophosphoesterase [Kingella oralis]|uniref:metallophosphoesterase n=1 Tax=Kingella oralis TaxID=505 RepID=UPI003F73B3AB
MKLHILSDTHGQTVTPHPDADLIVHAGDFGNGRRGAEAFQAACAAAGKPCVFVLGNHDFYGEHLDELSRELIRRQRPAAHRKPPLEIWWLHLRWRHAVEQFQAALRWQKTVSRKRRPCPQQHRRLFLYRRRHSAARAPCRTRRLHRAL